MLKTVRRHQVSNRRQRMALVMHVSTYDIQERRVRTELRGEVHIAALYLDFWLWKSTCCGSIPRFLAMALAFL